MAGTSASGTTGVVVAAKAPVKIGVITTNNAALAATFGVKSSDASDYGKKIIAYINKTGGIAGHKVEAVYYQADSAQSSSVNGAAACAAFTQDNHVNIVVAMQSLGNELPSCLRKAGLSMIDALNWTSDASDMRAHPNWFVPVAMRVDRAVGALLDVSLRRGVLRKGDKLGVLYEDCPWGPRVYDNVVVPFAKRAGVTLVYSTVQCVTNLAGDLGPVASQTQQAELKFSAQHVTHVIVPSVAEAFVVAEFTKVASQQQYLPKYLIDSNAYPYGDSASDAVVQYSPDALPNMSGAGFLPLFDVGALAKPANGGQLAAQRQCKQADPDLAGSEATTGSGRYFARNTAYDFCAEFFVAKALLEANGVRFSLSDVTRGYLAALNDSAFGAINLTNGHYHVGLNSLDGAAYMQPFSYNQARQGFEYVGTAFPVA
jgi:hypothetical protein